VDFEFLICDDSSTDESYAYLQTLSDKRVHLFRNATNCGLFPTLNYLLRESHGELIHLWSQDDIMLPGCLAETILFHEKYGNISMSYSGVSYIDSYGESIPDHTIDGTPAIISPELHAEISVLWGCIAGNIANVTLVKNAVEKYGYFNEAYKVSGDFELWARLSKEQSIGFLNKKLVALRRHTGQLSRRYSSILYRIQEDIPIVKEFVNRVRPEMKVVARRYLYWKLYPIYFNELIFLLRKKELGMVGPTLKEIRKVDNVFLLFFRWSFVRLLRVFALDSKFYAFLRKN
jgi:glycosyltransferase involved in cell wall biosynthesis